MIVRDATAKDLRDFYGKNPPVTVRAMVAVDDGGVPLAVGGYYLSNGAAIAFTDVKNMRKRDMVQAAKKFVERLRELPFDVLAHTYGNGAPLKHFGFEPVGPLWRLNK